MRQQQIMELQRQVRSTSSTRRSAQLKRLFAGRRAGAVPEHASAASLRPAAADGAGGIHAPTGVPAAAHDAAAATAAADATPRPSTNRLRLQQPLRRLCPHAHRLSSSTSSPPIQLVQQLPAVYVCACTGTAATYAAEAAEGRREACGSRKDARRRPRGRAGYVWQHWQHEGPSVRSFSLAFYGRGTDGLWSCVGERSLRRGREGSTLSRRGDRILSGSSSNLSSSSSSKQCVRFRSILSTR